MISSDCGTLSPLYADNAHVCILIYVFSPDFSSSAKYFLWDANGYFALCLSLSSVLPFKLRYLYNFFFLIPVNGNSIL